MKFKAMLLSFVLFSSSAWAGCVSREMMGVDVGKCLSVQCPEGTILGLKNNYHGYEPFCFPCDTEESFAFDCISIEEAKKICPNRYISYGCGAYSVLKCPDYQIKNKKEKTCQDPPGTFY